MNSRISIIRNKLKILLAHNSCTETVLSADVQWKIFKNGLLKFWGESKL